MQHYLNSKKINYEYGKLIVKLIENLLIGTVDKEIIKY